SQERRRIGILPRNEQKERGAARMLDVFSANDQQCSASDGVKDVFIPRVRYSGLRNDVADPDVIEKSLFASKPESNEISEDAIHDELSRILESSIFVQSDRLRRFL